MVKRTCSAALVLVFGLWLAPAPGGATAAGDTRSERERVQQEKAQVAAELDALRVDDAAVTQALADLNANVSGQEAMLQDAQRGLEQAEATLLAARADEQRTVDEIAVLEASMRALAVSAYVNGGTDDELITLASESINDAVHRQALLSFRATRDADIADQLEAARQDLERKRQEAEVAAAEAEARRAEIADRLGQLKSARDQQAQFAAAVDQRIEAALAEAAALDSLDGRLAQQLAAEQAALAARNRASTGGGGVPQWIGNVSVVSVGGIVVNVQIADEVRALLDAASSAGFSLGGGGYRDPAAQIAVRKANCGTSYYAIYQMPPSQCSPPTARPGTSMHEQGLAIDFTSNGALIQSRSNPAFVWLSNNAGRYGLYNLPSEPWHWSTNGQ